VRVRVEIKVTRESDGQFVTVATDGFKDFSPVLATKLEGHLRDAFFRVKELPPE
jgi:hypothetical protein